MNAKRSACVTGRIKSLSTGSGELFGGSGWQFSLQLTPWRGGDGAIVFAPLFVSLDGLDRAEAERIAGQFAAGSIVSVQAGDLTQTDPDRWTASFAGSQGTVTDDELAKAQPPAVPDYVHPVLGSFQWQQDVGLYGGAARWLGKEIELTLEGAPDEVHKAADHCLQMLGKDGVWQAECLDRAWQDLGQTWLQSWADDGEELTAQKWQARLSAKDLSIDFEGNFSLWFDDGDLFWGHSVCVSGNVASGAHSASMMG